MNDEIFLSLVVLCYKSGKPIIPLVESLHRMLSYLNFRWEIILVGNYDEGVKDETPQIVKEISSRLPNIVPVTLPKKGMAGWDLRTGLNLARGKYIGFIDGDEQIPLESIVTCILKIDADRLDLIKTYRVSRGDGFYRRAISIIYNKLFRILFRVNTRDINSNPKIFLKSKYLLLDLKSDDWFIDAEIMLRANELGLKIGEIPMHFYALTNRSSFVKVGTLYEFLKNMFNYRFKRLSPRPSCSQVLDKTGNGN